MKKLFTLAIIIILSTFSFAQKQTEPDQSDFRLSEVCIGSGEGALSSGISAGITLQKENTKCMFQVTSSYVQGVYGTQHGDFFIGGSIGAFQNTPWVAPYIEWTPVEWLYTLSWIGVSAGDAGNPRWKARFSFAFHQMKVSYSYFYAQWSLLNFQEDVPNNLPGVGVSIPLGKFKVSGGVEYSLRDKKPLFSGNLNIPF